MKMLVMAFNRRLLLRKAKEVSNQFSLQMKTGDKDQQGPE